MTNFFKTTINLVGTFLGGVAISTTTVLIVNDMFYNLVFRKLIKKNNKNKSPDFWTEIRPRELFGVGAKKTFLKHQIQDEGKDTESKIYHNYIESQKYEENEQLHLKQNIFNKNKNL